MEYPRYLKAARSGRLAENVERALALLEGPCRVCPRCCNVDRMHDQVGVCRTGRYAIVSSHFPHFGEEDCLRGWRGSGTIFFSYCNLKCVFCQNFDISQKGNGTEVKAEELAVMMVDLQDMGCHNINFVTPEHVVPQIIEALPVAIERGLRLPLVYNTSGFDSEESLALLDGLVDIYMPDFKFGDRETARRMVKAFDYPTVAKRSIREMHRQVGDLSFDEHGLAVRGLLVRHLVMPNDLAGTRETMRFLALEISLDTFVNVMDQYRPAWKTDAYAEINRTVTPEEYAMALSAAQAEGIHRFDVRKSPGFHL